MAMPDTIPHAPAPADARTRILDSAERIVQVKGVAGLTLDAAAREAGVSKGGLLYHFASKQALLIGLLTRLSASIEAHFEAVLALQPPGRGRVTRAMLAWTFDHPDSVCEQHERAAGVFLASFHQDPVLLDPIREVFARIRAKLREDGLPPGHAMAVMAACDGLFMSRVFEMYRLSDEEQRALRAALATLIGDLA
ncbi:TetR/AcrR family transcriptional regulator [Roseococcus sp. SYP-B2431]|uniref:TetR/AcrR family transcriptional regulator n=1 Tax=Roseococcus sp. SYP-B2431 TaxID=2496640 RepID=UPI001038D66A|nr:TetR/AcrR family transcriptional regulator [Roseococcus sp. SYP-B2431]TCH96719.1 TetR/AcrR family transcriptional regulator [Roseococcus sp. SYP-B2431]